MARKNRNPDEPAIYEIDGPSRLDVNPAPPEAVRVSRRAALVVLFVLCCLASVFGYGVYQRQHETMNAAFSANDSQKLVPATAAAKEITKDIPAGVINLATEAEETARQSGNSDGDMPKDSGPLTDATDGQPRGPANARWRLQTHSQQPNGPTPEQRLLSEAYGRELQAIAAPTVIRSSIGGGSVFPGRQYDAVSSSSADPSPLAVLAQLQTS